MHAQALSASDLDTLEEGAGEARDLIVEVVAAAKAQGHDVDFIAMSDALRESANREVYKGLMQRILADDETRRDLLRVDDGADEREDRRATRRQEQFDAAAQELGDVVHRLRAQIVDAQLARLMSQAASTGIQDPAMKEALTALMAERDRLRRRG